MTTTNAPVLTKVHYRAAQFWSVLAWAAHNRQLVTPRIMHQVTGLAMFGQDDTLGLIVKYCQNKNLPKLTSIVVGESDGLPQDRTATAEETGRQHAEVFKYKWLDERAPQPEDFEALAP